MHQAQRAMLMSALFEQFGRRLNTKLLEIQTRGLIQPCRECSQTALIVQMLSVPCQHVALATRLAVCCSSRHLEPTLENAVQRTQIISRKCRRCRKRTRFERHVTAMGCGDLLLVIATLGLWLILRWLFTPGYRCSICSGK